VYYLSSVAAFAQLAQKFRYDCELHTTESELDFQSTTTFAVLSLVSAG